MAEFLETNKDINERRFLEDMSTKDWLGYIVDSNDELKMGRCRIRVFEIFDALSDGDIPWAFPAYSPFFAGGSSKGCGSFSYPKVGTLVRVKFQNGDIYSPEYYMVQNLNDKMRDEFSGSYENCHVLLYDEDEDLKIIYTKSGGLIIWHKESHMTIDKNTHITIEHSSSSSIMTYIDGVITIKSNDEVNVITNVINKKADTNINATAGVKIHYKSPNIHMDSPVTQLGPNGHVPAVRCPELISLLMAMAAVIDSTKIVLSPAATNLVASMAPAICSTTVFVAV